MRKGEKRMSKYYGMEAQDVRKAVNGGTEPLTAEQIKKNQEALSLAQFNFHFQLRSRFHTISLRANLIVLFLI